VSGALIPPIRGQWVVPSSPLSMGQRQVPSSPLSRGQWAVPSSPLSRGRHVVLLLEGVLSGITNRKQFCDCTVVI
jgi:hypothetical protein